MVPDRPLARRYRGRPAALHSPKLCHPERGRCHQDIHW